jgi:carboxyl-terminal processing protease
VIDRQRAFLAGLVAVLVAAVLGFYVGQSGLVGNMASDGPTNAAGGNWAQLDLVKQYINTYYFGSEPVSAKDLEAGAARGMVAATGDRYSQYFTPQEFQQFNEVLSDHFSGIGARVEISAKTGRVTVVSPIKDSPAEKAGIRAGDEILAVNGEDITDKGLDEAVALIRGPEGSTVKLTLLRPPSTTPFELTVVRGKILSPEMDYKLLPDHPGVGYIHVYEFNTKIAERVRDAIADLKKQGMTRGLVLDMRFNPGGLLTEAVDMASLFVPTDALVLAVQEKNGARQEYKAKDGPKLGLPLVVLVDSYTASAAEIVSGAIKDHKVGKLVGETTFGKGVVQSTWQFPDGSGLKLTTAHWLTPGGTWINGKGITPDVEVRLPAENSLRAGDIGTAQDVQFQKALEVLLQSK